MDLSHDPWTNEQIRFQSSAATLDTFSEISIPNQISIRTPGESLVVPGEPVLCKTRARETNYWPARLVKYEGSSRRQARTQTEELFCVKFCDDVRMVVPRSFFLTAFQKEFKTAKLGELETTEVTWEQILPKLKKETQKLDSIISGSYMEQSVVDRHEDYLTRTPEGHRQLAEGVSYGQYPKAVITGVTEHLQDRYIFHLTEPIEIVVDSRFLALTKEEKKVYLQGVILPEAIILITQQDFLDQNFEKP
ncbi:hypothetical protein PCASD_06332 [Puccinia coronata f. sp. avenae]|uniref:Uncharacterized protein n=1 Tax=Puccinia coronata f. sp. avenae TaxID=200324 RepID=A0A2N5V931_9BASI|nr:hypothetical protein PCASD_06332 [Puccinia coronata f. sp. avenae]